MLDIIAQQETRCSSDEWPLKVQLPHYYATFNDNIVNKGYSGVALYSIEKPLRILTDVNDQELDDECRLIAAEFENFYAVCINAPTSGETLEKLPKRLKWDKKFYLCLIAFSVE